MRVFVTGASGFVGFSIVNELLSNGHSVSGLVRTEDGFQKLEAVGAKALLGDINDIGLITRCAVECDAVIHTAFNHDFSKFKESCEADRRVIEALGDAMAGTVKPLIITSGIGILRYGRVVNENDVLNVGSDTVPRAATEEAAVVAAAKGANVYVVRLPPSVHGAGEHGFVPMIIEMSKDKGRSAYIGEGQNCWPAVHCLDAAKVYCRIAELKPMQKVFHAVAERGIPFVEIAEKISTRLNLPLANLAVADAEKHFTWFTHFAMMDCASENMITRETLGWEPVQIGLLEDMERNYF